MENEKEGFPITALREIKILQLLKHENVVNLIEICRTSSNAPKYKATFYLVFDFCEHDLAGLLSNNAVQFTLGKDNCLLSFVNFCFFQSCRRDQKDNATTFERLIFHTQTKDSSP